MSDAAESAHHNRYLGSCAPLVGVDQRWRSGLRGGSSVAAHRSDTPRCPSALCPRWPASPLLPRFQGRMSRPSEVGPFSRRPSGSRQRCRLCACRTSPAAKKHKHIKKVRADKHGHRIKGEATARRSPRPQRGRCVLCAAAESLTM